LPLKDEQEEVDSNDSEDWRRKEGEEKENSQEIGDGFTQIKSGPRLEAISSSFHCGEARLITPEDESN